MEEYECLTVKQSWKKYWKESAYNFLFWNFGAALTVWYQLIDDSEIFEAYCKMETKTQEYHQ